MNKPGQFTCRDTLPIRPLHSHLEIHTLEWFQQNRPDPVNKTGKAGSYEIIWVKSGAGLLITGSAHYEISNRNIYFLACGQLKRIVPENEITGYYISLSPDILYEAETGFNFFSPRGKDKDTQNAVLVSMDEATQAGVEDLLLKMKKEFNGFLSLRLEMITGLFRIFMLYLSRKLIAADHCQKQTRDAELAKRFLHLLRTHFTTKKMVADYANELNVTPSYLNLVVKKVSGLTASHHIQQYLVAEAKRQALYSNRSMKEIAYGLGFDDTAHFSKFFKNNSGVNFTSFKKSDFIFPGNDRENFLPGSSSLNP